VIEQDGLELGRVGGERVERRLGHLRERGVGRREDGEGPARLQRVDEAGGLEERRERLELARGDGRRDDVGLACGRLRRGGGGEHRGCGDDRQDEDERPLAHAELLVRILSK
jgi:hypothetical protein